MDDLAAHWPRALAACAGLRRRLLESYGAPHRRYHDVRHLTEVLERATALLEQPGLADVDGDTVLLAAWFHDAVHDGRDDDEERSAALAETTLAACDVPAGTVAEVARLVRLTRHHRPEPEDLAGQVLCDADLAILAAGPARYGEYVRAVREEYTHVAEDAFRAGRAAVLRALLDGPLFHTPAAREAWEERARANVEAELDRLLGR